MANKGVNVFQGLMILMVLILALYALEKRLRKVEQQKQTESGQVTIRITAAIITHKAHVDFQQEEEFWIYLDNGDWRKLKDKETFDQYDKGDVFHPKE